MELDIKELFRRAFGYEAPESFNIEHAPDRIEKSSSNLGAPYYDTDDYGREFFLPVMLDGYLLPFAIISINCKKTIIATAMPERQGSVHEQISVDDYVISIKGILINDSNEYPEKEVIDLQNIFEKNQAVELRSVLSDIFLKGGFEHSVIVKSLNFSPIGGVQNALPYELELESDMVFTLEIK